MVGKIQRLLDTDHFRYPYLAKYAELKQISDSLVTQIESLIANDHQKSLWQTVEEFVLVMAVFFKPPTQHMSLRLATISVIPIGGGDPTKYSIFNERPGFVSEISPVRLRKFGDTELYCRGHEDRDADLSDVIFKLFEDAVKCNNFALPQFRREGDSKFLTSANLHEERTNKDFAIKAIGRIFEVCMHNTIDERTLTTVILPVAKSAAKGLEAVWGGDDAAYNAAWVFKTYIEDDNRTVGLAASTALSDLGYGAWAVDVLPLCLKDGNDDIIRAAFEALADIGEAASAVPGLMKRLEDDDADSRYWAAKSLGNIGVAAAAAVPSLREMVEKESKSYIRDRAQETLRAIQAAVEASR